MKLTIQHFTDHNQIYCSGFPCFFFTSLCIYVLFTFCVLSLCLTINSKNDEKNYFTKIHTEFDRDLSEHVSLSQRSETY